MGVRPDFRLFADAIDISLTIQSRFSSLTLTDEAGLESDTLELVLTDNDPLNPLMLPPTGAELELWLGYDGELARMGLFVVDEIELSGPPDAMRITARAAPQEKSSGGKSSLLSQKTRSFVLGTLLGEIAKVIAAEHGLELKADDALAQIALPHIDQVNESDINLLTRIIKPYDAMVKPAGGFLVLAKRGESKAVSGAALLPVLLGPNDVTTWSATLSRRTPAASVVANWRDIESAEDQEVRVGEGEPEMRLRHPYPDAASALSAAQTALDQGQRPRQQSA